MLLTRFWVEGYRGFDRRLEIDFTDKKNYGFGTECINGDVLDKIVVLGGNGSGKTNLGYALCDLIDTLTDKGHDMGQYSEALFLNADSPHDRAVFHYEFMSGGTRIEYEYAKTSVRRIVSERLRIGRKLILDYGNGSPPHLRGIDRSRLDGSVSAVILARDCDPEYREQISALIGYADHMLYYRSVWKIDGHSGLATEQETVDRYIVNHGLAEDVTRFLRDVAEEDLQLTVHDGELYIRSAQRDLPFKEAASRGTSILCQFYCWSNVSKDSDSLLFFDDFDCMYHFRIAERLMRSIISRTRAQCVFVTHGTGLVSNDLIRPDCCFLLNNGSMRSLASLTTKSIRKANNIEKMLREGEFDGLLASGEEREGTER